ncbi:hypothetical protein MUK42_35883 [Musa troglodytarum]|uniref:Neprosin activation peptide domain-containing protein n=1 Tax=Musa troglodytarum TaxID=320322 RepID=A0A9E7EFK0_9LILI|nr:hypothetical protein MUK42_35883 [Musa troglodytarum]
MAANTCCRPILIPSVSLVLLLLLAATAPAISSSEGRTLLERLNKRSTKTIQSPDGDIIDCVPSHLQPAFDHPMLKGSKPLDPPERPSCHTGDGMADDVVQLWTTSGETCPEGTVPIRRTKEEDILRIERFGRKPFASEQNQQWRRNRLLRESRLVAVLVSYGNGSAKKWSAK